MIQKVLEAGKSLERALFPSFCLNCTQATPEEPPAWRWLCLKCHQILVPRWQKVSYRPEIEESYHIFDYQKDFLAKRLIQSLKYNFVKEIAASLGVALEKERLHIKQLNFDLTVPVPLHARRLKERGFNQSFLISQKISEITEKQILTDVLVRNKSRLPQAKIKNRAERAKNIQNIFSCVRPNLIAEKTILLVDDVATTGATLKECARSLKTAGALKILSFTLAQD